MGKRYLKPHKCPVCGKYTFPHLGSYDICEECGWEDDRIQTEDPDYWGGANELSLNQFKEKYESGWRAEWIEK